MPRFLNNPGLGNCGYYSFSIGLIDIIKQELKNSGSSRTLENLNRFVEPELTAEDFQTFNLKDYAYQTGSYKRHFLDTFQNSLRKIAVQGYTEALRESVTKERLRYAENLTLVDGNETFSKFLNIVRAKLYGTRIDDEEYNELAGTEAEKNLAPQVIARCHTPQFMSLAKDHQDQALRKIAKSIFNADIFNADGTIRVDSVITNAIRNQLMTDGYWATHDHLRITASKLKVNLNVNNVINGLNDPALPTIVLNNSNNIHWTTLVYSLESQDLRHSSSRHSATIGNTTPPRDTTQTILDAIIDKARKECQDKNLDPSIFGKYLDLISELMDLATNPESFKINATDSEDVGLAKKLQEQELADAGFRTPKNP